MKTPIEDRERKHAKCFRPVRGENDAISAGLQPGEAPLHPDDFKMTLDDIVNAPEVPAIPPLLAKTRS